MLFGTNGIRGKFNELTPNLALELAQAIGIFFKKGTVLVARDGRLTGECLKHAVISGLQSVGCEVIDLNFASAPTSEFALKTLKADGLIIITASHNPPEWNALKVVDKHGITLSKERGEEIERLMGNPKLEEWGRIKKSKKYEEASYDHIKSVKNLVNQEKIRSKKLKLVLDCGNGMAALVAPRLFRDLGCEIITLNSNVDGHFPGRPSEPTEANLQELIKTVKSVKAYCGIAWDGDGDRVVLVDENGGFIVGDKVYALCAISKLKGVKGKVVTTVATSKCIEDVASNFGCATVYTKIGAPYISEKVYESKAALGGEEVGGVIWPELSLAKDGFMTAAKIVEMLTERSLSGWLKEIPKYYNEKIKIEADQSRKEKIIQKIKEYAKKNKFNIIDIDGVRINFEDSWVIVRASGTEPYIRIFAEAKDKKRAKDLIEEYKKLTGEI
ncbi:phosphoglucosamine mutase [Candidatus Micrarchaeota archaeon]|nr:phosphoglucosamine mutase [Candidatus Micrarchaeota archaeon]